MANQDPQPEIYTTRYNFNADTNTGGATIAANTSQVVSIYTNQANNEAKSGTKPSQANPGTQPSQAKHTASTT